jgi:hypothetical protein
MWLLIVLVLNAFKSQAHYFSAWCFDLSSEEREVVFIVKVRDKEIEVDEKVLSIVQEYLKTPMSLEELAEKLGLESWEEAYEFLKAMPAWIMWTPPSLWKYRKKWVADKLAEKKPT